jgi:hypothetical protein
MKASDFTNCWSSSNTISQCDSDVQESSNAEQKDLIPDDHMQWEASIRPPTPNPNAVLEKPTNGASCHANDTYCLDTFTETQAPQSLRSHVSTTTITDSEASTANTTTSDHYSSLIPTSELCGAFPELSSDVELVNLLDISAGTFSGKFANTQDISLSSRGILATATNQFQSVAVGEQYALSSLNAYHGLRSDDPESRTLATLEWPSIASSLAGMTSQNASPASPFTSQQSSDNRSESIYETSTVSQDTSPMQRCFEKLCSMLHVPSFNRVDILEESSEVENLQHLAVNGLREARTLPSNQNDHGVMLWACNFGSCSRTYRHSQSLRKHERVCHEVKYWVCNYTGCGITYDNTSSLTQHRESAHGIEAWICNLGGCDNLYIRKSSRNRHNRFCHGAK